MDDREKLLIWLEKCYGICNEDTECDECPFFTLNEGGCTSRLREVLTRELLKEQPNAVQCKDCKYWGKKSGLTARKCSRQGIITGQFDFCSYGRTVKQNDSN